MAKKIEIIKAHCASIERWFEYWEIYDDPNLKGIFWIDECELCSVCCTTVDMCETCPVYQKTGKILCKGTPFGAALDAIMDEAEPSLKLKRRRILREYEFLVDLLPNPDEIEEIQDEHS